MRSAKHKLESLSINPFRFSGPIEPNDMIDRNQETVDLLSLAQGGHSFRLVGARRYGKTTLLQRVLDEAEAMGMATVLVDLEDVLTLGEIVVRIERAYEKRLKGALREKIDALLRAWNVGLSLGGAGFAATLQHNHHAHPEAVLLRLLELPTELYRRTGTRSFIVFDEIQDVLAVPGIDGKLRSVIQHQAQAAVYAFAGSAPGVMEQLFVNPKRPLLEQAVPVNLAPLPLNEVGDYVAKKFLETEKNVGSALDLLIEFTRGHPQRSMLFAHYLWEHTGQTETADELTWLKAKETVTRATDRLMRAIWKSLSVNERRIALTLAVHVASPYSKEAIATTGINPNSIRSTIDQLRDQADIIEQQNGQLRLTDPLFEYWLKRRGILPTDENTSSDL